MSLSQHSRRPLALSLVLAAGFGLAMPQLLAQENAPAISKQTIAGFDKAMAEAGNGASEARQRLALRRVIRDAEQLVETHKDDPSRFLGLEFLFRAYQRLIAMDDDSAHRKTLLEICRELVKAPDDLAELRLEADLLLNQAELAKQGADAEARANALRPLVDRYVDTPAGAKVLRMAMLIALELGDTGLVNHLRGLIAERFATDHDLIAFQRDKLGGQVFGAPFAGHFTRSDGKAVRFPMDLLGRSTMLLFWSKEDSGLDYVKGLAAAALESKELVAGRLEIISFNLDNLPDAGESIIRGLGVDWQVLQLPGGRENPVFKAYARSSPLNLRVSPTGQAALVMAGTDRVKVTQEGTTDYKRTLQSTLSRSWTDERYTMHLASLMAGDFLVLDPEGAIDPTLPPEFKAAVIGGELKPLNRDAASVPEETLRAIQESFVMPPRRYRLSHQETKAAYAKAVELSRKAIADHPDAPNLWIVRNRLIIALLGLWKTEADLSHLEAAIAEAKAALDSGAYPEGCDFVARFCMARAALRDPAANPGEVIDRFLSASGGESASGPALAAAALLALDVADRVRFGKLREAILNKHTEQPGMWIFSSFLLDRYHRYWLFQEPFQAGWTYGRREKDFMSTGAADEVRRILKTELRTAEGKPLRIPEDLDSEWTMIVFSASPPWSAKREDSLPASPEQTLMSFNQFAATRPPGNVKVLLATLDGEPEKTRADLLASRNKLDVPVLSVPGGIENPLAHRLGMLSEDERLNSVLIAKDGRIALAISGLGQQGGGVGGTLGDAICHEDEIAVNAALERGDIQAAKTLIMTLAPPYDPDAVDEKGRKLKKPEQHIAHVRARARVFMALKDYDKALADAEEIYSRQYAADSGMSQRTRELDEAEKLRAEIRQLMGTAGETR
jgi:tetratricopeptide (TPR) repeat protein